MTTSQAPLQAGLGLFGWMLVLPCLGATIWYPYSHGDYVLAGLAAAVAIGAVLGHKLGAAKFIGLFIGGVVGTCYAESLGKQLEPITQSFLQQEGPICQTVSQVAVMVGASFLAVLVSQILVSVLAAGCPSIQIVNQRFGFLIGSAQGLVFAVVFLCALLAVEPIASKKITANPKPENKDFSFTVSEKIVELAAVVRPSPFCQYLDKFNPFEHVECLKKLRQGIEVFAEPGALEKIVKSPEFSKLATRPDLKQSFQELAADPKIKQMLISGQVLDAQAMASLVTNPSLQKLMSDPQVMEEVSKVLARTANHN